ncbi:MAG TPA: oxygen-independent coproporphyrinogen III oxidase [Candidatus Merdenecus merdavium]|nr:oxygen-independent coproporphyrinogen III oxidase [Candidatus Merdenecus merdavium]
MNIHRENSLGIYIHIPFCEKKCEYCDFLSFPSQNKLMDQYMEALIDEIAERKYHVNQRVATVFFGGGTPSLIEGQWIEKVMKALRERFYFWEDVEITLEINPGTVTYDKFMCYQKAGVNRLSIGLQSTMNEELKVLGRIHTYEKFLESYHLARDMGFTNINIDLMAALPGQTVESYRTSLQRVAQLHPEHISAYSLIIEEGTPFYDFYGKDAIRREEGKETTLLPSEEEERSMYYDTKRILKEYGYERYEISNYSLKGRESKHNTCNWRRWNYIGYGLGSSGLLDHQRLKNTDDINQYIKGNWIGEVLDLSKNEEMEEFMFLGLRMIEGIKEEEFIKEFQCTIDQVFGKNLERLIEEELIIRKDGCISLSEKGIDLSNYVLSEFLIDE